MDHMVECVFFGEEIIEREIGRGRRFVHEADVAACAEVPCGRAAIGLRAGRTLQHHGVHGCIVAPGLQCVAQFAHHGQVQRVERLRAVQGDHPHTAHDFGQHQALHPHYSGKTDSTTNKGRPLSEAALAS